MPEKTKWNLYEELEAEVAALWEMVQDTLNRLDVYQRDKEEIEQSPSIFSC
jgi:hypothetical protein